MKYLKLFEAFESEKLTKTLGYIDKKSREELVKILRNLCSGMDFPFSQLNDSYFQYLPYLKALDLQYVGKETPCKATSKSEFSSHGIEGESCQSGKMKRMWGTRQRIVDCPHCNGTGIEPEKSEIKLIKFWFTKEGEMVTITGVDNTVKPQTKSKSKGKFSKNISDYIVTGDVVNRRGNISFLNDGDFVLAKLNTGSDDIICYVLKERNRTYLIQDYHDGDTPSGDYRKIARYSWNITDGDFITLRKVEPKKKETDENEDEDEIDPFSFNKAISVGYRGSLSFDRYRDVEKLVQKAHFALVFNLDSLKTTQFKTKSEIGQERTEIKSGSRLTVRDEDIKKANIERYMREIALRSDIISDVSNLPKVVKRFLGGENVLFLMIYNSRFAEHIYKLADLYTQALSEGKEDYYKNRLSTYISDRYKSVSTQNSTISNNIKYIKEKLRDVEESKVYLEILESLENLSKKLYQKISQIPMECVEDLDIIKAKLDSLRSIFRSSRYHFDKMDYFIDSLTGSTNPENSLRYLTSHYYTRDYKREILQGINQADKVLDRF